MTKPTLLRADQLLARFGYCSRREAPSWVKRGRVTINGAEILDPSKRIDPAQAAVDGVSIEFPHGVLVAFHKPVGYVCTHEEEEGGTIYDVLPSSWIGRIPSVTSVGRLDKETSGLLIITDDGALVHRWTSPKKHVRKVYEVETDERIPASAVANFASGELILRSETEPCQPAELEITGPRTARITLLEGRYHQVRRMFASQGCSVMKLHRTHIGQLALGELAEGAWKEITVADVDGA
jgi:16S rRNA pseudouridine516 synthase